MPEKRVGERARDGDGRIGERRRRGEPIGRGDVEADQPGHGRPVEAGRRPEWSRSGRRWRPPSANHCAPPVRTFSEASSSGSANIACAITSRRCRRRSAPPRRTAASRGLELPPEAKTRVTAGLKCAPEIGPRIVISTTRIAPVGSVLPSSASATSLVSVSAMMPEPTTVATSSAVPSASAARRRCKSKGGISLRQLVRLAARSRRSAFRCATRATRSPVPSP